MPLCAFIIHTVLAKYANNFFFRYTKTPLPAVKRAVRVPAGSESAGSGFYYRLAIFVTFANADFNNDMPKNPKIGELMVYLDF